jgi:hypothetical protein
VESKFLSVVEYPSDSGSLGFSLFGNPIGQGKAAAAFDACNKAKADVIIAPRYTVETMSYVVYSKTTITVKGYKGVFKGLKK